MDPVLAHLNIALLKRPREHPSMSGFFDNVARVNALAEASEGFLWRLLDDAPGSNDARLVANPRLLANVSVWTSVEALKAFSYASLHGEFVRRRKEWFDPQGQASYVLWWIPGAHRPTMTQALDRLESLRRHGPSPEAFTFAHAYPPVVDADVTR
jgi:Domain of unknown function (DUF3291)